MSCLTAVLSRNKPKQDNSGASFDKMKDALGLNKVKVDDAVTNQSSSASGKSQQPVQPSAAPLIQPGGTVNAAYPQTNPFQPTSEPLKTIPATSSPQENPFLKKMGEVNKFAHGWGGGAQKATDWNRKLLSQNAAMMNQQPAIHDQLIQVQGVL